MLIGEKISNYCEVLKDIEGYTPTDKVLLVEITFSDELQKRLDSPVLVPEQDLRRLLAKQKTGKIIKIGAGSEKFMGDEVKLGDGVYFTNTDYSLLKHPEKDVFYKFVEACDIIAYIKN